ncbi:MAG: DNA/RNA non-specific endonuclease [Kineosporiaceae bacterium]|nr:DNA/RNA non-specific endonuclease [Kineosporiaceae bacterium]
MPATSTGEDAVAALTLPPGDGLAAARAVMNAVDAMRPGPGMTVETTYRGRPLVLTVPQAERVRAAAREALTKSLARSLSRAEYANDRYRAQRRINAEHPVSSRIARAWSFIRTGGGHSDPGDRLGQQLLLIEVASELVRAAIGAGRFGQAAENLASVETLARRSSRLVEVYINQLIEGAESAAGGLEFTRDAAFLTLGVLAVVATGGAAAGAAPGVIGTGIGGLTVGGTATVISVGAPIVAGVGVGAVRTAYGDRVDWGAIMVDAAAQVVLAKVGGRFGQGLFGRLVGNPATAGLAKKALASLTSGLATHELSQAFSVSVQHTYDALRGRDVTWEAFLEDLERRLTDPKGLFMAAVMSGVQLGANVAVDRATPRPMTPKPAPGGITTPAAGPGASTTATPAPSQALSPPKSTATSTVVSPMDAPVNAPAKAPVKAPGQAPVKAPTPSAVAAQAPTTPAAPPTAAPKPSPKATPPKPAASKSPTKPGGGGSTGKGTGKSPGKGPGKAIGKPSSTSKSKAAGRPQEEGIPAGEAMVEALRLANQGATLEHRVLESPRTRIDSSPRRSPGRAPRRSPKPSPTGTPQNPPPFEERVLIGDLENGLPTGVMGRLHPSDLHTGTPSSSDVNPPGLVTGELNALRARRGHLLANLFGGSGRDLGNLAWMHEQVNNSAYKIRFENPVRAALEGGREVRFTVEPKYRPGENAPFAIEVWAADGNGVVIVEHSSIPTPALSDI